MRNSPCCVLGSEHNVSGVDSGFRFLLMLTVLDPMFSAGDPVDAAFESERSESRRWHGFGP